MRLRLPSEMALKSITGVIQLPSFWASRTAGNGTSSASNITLGAQNQKVCVVMQASKGATISKVHFFLATVTDGSDVDVRIETVSATDGNPTGTLWAANTNVVITIADTDDNSWKQAALTAGAVVNQGDIFAVVINIQDALGISIQFGGILEYDFGFPYVVSDTGGGFVKRGECLRMLIEFGDGTFQALTYAGMCANAAPTTFNSGSNPDEIGNLITLPIPCRVVGFWAWLSLLANATVLLYDNAGTVLTSLALDSDQVQAASTDANLFGFFPTSVVLTADQSVRLTVRPDTTSNVSLDAALVAAGAHMGAFSFGTGIARTHRTDGGAWTQDALTRHQIGFLVDQLDDGVGTGAGIAHIIGG